MSNLTPRIFPGQGKRIRLLACFLITLFIMCNTIAHIMFEGVRPFDWLMFVIEALVLILILYEVIIEIVHRRADTRRHAFINEKVLVLSALWDKGKRIQSIVPDTLLTTDLRIAAQWITEVKAWTQETRTLLGSDSPKAMTAFMDITDASKVNLNVTASGRTFHLRGEPQVSYQRLVVQLENLRRIIVRPEAYF